MGLKILTGVLTPRQISGHATIYFDPHQVTGDADGFNLAEVGDQGDFDQSPQGFIALKHFTVQDRNKFIDDSGRTAIEECQIENRAPTIEQMIVSWRATKGAKIKEIAYMIIGEA